MKKAILKFSIVALIFLAFTPSVKAQLYVKMADSVGVWSEPQQFTYKAATGIEGIIKVRVKWLKRKSTTCFYEVEVTNIGTTEFRGVFHLSAKEMGAIPNVNNLSGNLKPNYYVSGKIEMRECWPKGAKGMSDIERCRACNPKLYFAGNIIK